MPKENPFPAGDYELLGPWAKLVSERGKPDEFVHYEPGDIVTLTAEDAERFCSGPVPVAQKPGESERIQAERLKADADAAQARADAAQDRAKKAAQEQQQAAGRKAA